MKQYRLDRGEGPDVTQISAAVVKAAMPTILDVIAEKTRELAPRSGAQHRATLSEHIETRIERGGERGVVAAVSPHAHLVHDGTKRHLIGTKKRGMPIPMGGGAVIRRGALHPGSKANPFMVNALEQSQGAISEALEEAGARAIEEAR